MELSSGSIAVFNDDQRVRSIFLNNKTLWWSQRATADVTSLAMTPSGSAILVGTENGNTDLFDRNGTLSWSYASNPGNKPGAGIISVALSKEGTVAAAGSNDGKIIALNAEGEVIWSNQTKDTIRHIAMSADGSFVVATGQNTVYAFSQSVQPKPTVRATGNSSIPVPSRSVTIVPGTSSTQKPVTSEPVSREITAVPTEYSVIRTSTQSPLSGFIPLVGIVVALFIVMRKR
jgi:WD40 repeat protein